jgi:predicted O-methyltransferase YrrM
MEQKYKNSISYKDSAWQDNTDFAVKLVETFNPEVIVELGVDFGYSSFCFAYPKIGHVYGLDWFKGDGVDWKNNYTEVDNLPIINQKYKELNENFGVDNITFIKGDFNETCKVWDKKIDILHIDGLHYYANVKEDFENWIKFCTDDSIILFHDTLSFPDDVGKFFNELEGYKHNVEVRYGLGIYTKSKKVFDKIKTIV